MAEQIFLRSWHRGSERRGSYRLRTSSKIYITQQQIPETKQQKHKVTEPSFQDVSFQESSLCHRLDCLGIFRRIFAHQGRPHPGAWPAVRKS